MIVVKVLCWGLVALSIGMGAWVGVARWSAPDPLIEIGTGSCLLASLIWGMRNAISAAIEEARDWQYPWPYETSWGNLVVDGLVLPAVWGGCAGSALVLMAALIAHAITG